jgi:hypothetical protein
MGIDWEYLGEQPLPPGTVAPWKVQTWRSPVPGGWLVLVINYTPDKSTGVTFYPDAAHGWNGHSLPMAQNEADLSEANISNDESDEDARFWAMQRFEDEENKR